jgi:methionine synthase I (cobalamin-dependent)
LAKLTDAQVAEMIQDIENTATALTREQAQEMQRGRILNIFGRGAVGMMADAADADAS